MSDKPDPSPETEAQVMQAIGARRTRTRDALRSIAKAQQIVILCILVYLAGLVCLLSLPAEIRPLLSFAMLGVWIVCAVFVFQLASQVYSTGTGVVLGILTVVPCIGLIVLVIVNSSSDQDSEAGNSDQGRPARRDSLGDFRGGGVRSEVAGNRMWILGF